MKYAPVQTSGEDLFVHYSEILQQLRDCIQQEDSLQIAAKVREIKQYIGDRKYPVESVKSWLLKMVMELELKYVVMQNFVNNFNSERLQRSIQEFETLEQLMEWLEEFLKDKILMLSSMWKQNVRKEVAEAKRYVMNHISEKVGMEEMAKRLGLNPTHFSRLFRLETGLTFIEYVTRVKMEQARDLLNQTNLTIVEIAEQLGYDNVSYFIKLFRNFSGITPANSASHCRGNGSGLSQSDGSVFINLVPEQGEREPACGCRYGHITAVLRKQQRLGIRPVKNHGIRPG